MVEEERDPRLPLERKTVRLVDGRKRSEGTATQARWKNVGYVNA
jgi:hypothetical protein